MPAPPPQPSRPLLSPHFWRLLGQGLVVIAVFHLLLQIFYWFPLNWARSDRFRDFTVYYDAAMRLKHGQPLYQPWPEFAPTILPYRYFYPPPFMLVARPLVELPYIWFGRVWSCMLLVAFWVYAACLANLATGKVGWRAVLIAGMVIDMGADGYRAMGFGNFEVVVWACYGLAFATSFRGAPLAFATMMKLHPIWALALVINDEGKRALLPALVVLFVGFGAGIWVCGIENSLQWWPSTSNVVSQGTFNSDNVSLSFALIRLICLLGWHYPGGPFPTWVRLYLSATALAAPLATMFLSRRQPRELRYALVSCSTILFAPLCWTIYLPLLLSPLAILWRRKFGTNKTSD